MEDRSKYYKQPMRFGSQTLYESDLLSDISLGHWEAYHNKCQNDSGYKIGDFIDTAVNLTAKQLVKFLDELSMIESIDVLQNKCTKYISEIQKEVKLDE